MSEIIISPNWRYKINIKNQFEDETTPELIITLCTSLVKQLNSIKTKLVESDRIDEDDKYNFEDKLSDEIGNWEHLMHLADGTIQKDRWCDYCFSGDFQYEFNGYLSQLYDLADERILLKNNISEKFIWIG